MPRQQSDPRTFFLNEAHELLPFEKSGGGRLPQYAAIPWAARALKLSGSLQAVATAISGSNDPLKENRCFMVALPEPELEKISADKKKAPHGTYKERTAFGGAHGRVFDRLGIDLLQVTEDGKAVVHVDAGKLEQLITRTEALESLGVREQSRWAQVDSFETVPVQMRVDMDWVQSLKPDDASDVVIELQPILSRVEADQILRAISDLMGHHQNERLTGTGIDFSGRHWFRGRATRKTVRVIARDFYSVQSLHSPLFSVAATRQGVRQSFSHRTQAEVSRMPDVTSLPCVAVLDMGIPSDHTRLAPFRRGQFIAQGAARNPVGDHGSFVASRVVFGNCDSPNDLATSTGRCTFYDAIVADYPLAASGTNRVNDKTVMESLRGVRGAAPDVRVFNLSFGDVRPLESFPTIEKREKRLMLQDLDNFIFASDSLVIVAAGNSEPGVVPNSPYPDHHEDPRWALGPWACGFNTLVCGSFVDRPTTDDLVQNVHWPSPFTRIGPGLCAAPVPSFSAEGGNTDTAYRFRPGQGVFGLSARGLIEDKCGTSYAAPILAREAALTLQVLQQYCLPGAHPFGVTARAFMTITATAPPADDRARELVQRTLGHGKASVLRLIAPSAGSALFLWQGVLESARDVVRVQIPIPRAWLADAEEPRLRLVVCSDPPVNEVAHATWACRRIKPVLHLGPDAPSLRAPSGGHSSYPVVDRTYNLTRFKPDGPKSVEGDMWLIEFAYEEIAPYPPGMDFDPRQKIAFAAELWDSGESVADPQPTVQALPIAATMNRLSVQPTSIRNPVIIRTRVS